MESSRAGNLACLNRSFQTERNERHSGAFAPDASFPRSKSADAARSDLHGARTADSDLLGVALRLPVGLLARRGGPCVRHSRIHQRRELHS